MRLALPFAMGLATAGAIAGIAAFRGGDDPDKSFRSAQLPRCPSRSSSQPSISADGRHLAFTSRSRQLGSSGGIRTTDVFLRDLIDGTTALISRASGSSGAAMDGDSSAPALSADGKRVAFASKGGDLAQIFVRDLPAQTTTLVSRASGPYGAVAAKGAERPAISADGRFVAFESAADNLSARDGPGTDVFVRDLATQRTVLVSVGFPRGRVERRRSSAQPTISHDGRLVAFASWAPSRDPLGSGFSQVYLRDLRVRTTTLVSRGSGARGREGDYWSGDAAISADGDRVVFTSTSDNLSPDKPRSEFNDLDAEGEGYGYRDFYAGVFVRDIAANRTTLASRAEGVAGAGAIDFDSLPAAISADGSVVAFTSESTGLVGAGEPFASDQRRVFVRDPERGTTTLVAPTDSAVGATVHVFDPSISADGRFVAFTMADADKLGRKRRDVYVRDLDERRTRLVSGVACAGPER